MRNATPRTRLFLAAVAAVAACAGAYGFAASLGMGGTGLAADADVLTACGTGMRVGYTTAFDGGVSAYVVTGVELSNIPAGCLKKEASVTFEAGDQVSGSAVTFALPAAGTAELTPIDPSANTIDAGRVSSVSVAVS